MNALRQVITDEAAKALAERNAERVRAEIERMGSKWLLHPKSTAKPLLTRRLLNKERT